MKKGSLVKSVAAASLVMASVCCVVGCSGSGDTKLTGGVAATVNGVEISEDTITLAIEDAREVQSLSDATAWGEYLSQTGYTPQSFREMVVDGYIDQEILRQKAADMGVTADKATVDSYVENMKANYGSDEAWEQALEKTGLTEEKYRESLELSILQQGVTDALTVDQTPSEDTVLSYAQMYGSYYDGAKRSSHILFDAADEATAQSVLDQINAGTLDFAEAAKQYSKDSSGETGGDVGWDKLSSFVTEYTEGLAPLEVGQVSGLVASQYGIHIIKCTDKFVAPSEITSIDQLPEAFADSVSAMAEDSMESELYQNWLTEQREASEIIINEMPAAVPYNVEVAAEEEEVEAESADGEDVEPEAAKE